MLRWNGHNIKSWGLAVAAIAAIGVAIPAVADKATEQRSATSWTQKAQAFAAFELPEQTIAADFIQAETAAARDLAEISTLYTADRHLRQAASDTMAEAQCLAEAVYYEARSESKPGQVAVAQVVKNRVASKHYPNTICGVVYQGVERGRGCQFSFACDGSMDRALQGLSWIRSKRVAALAMTGQAADMTGRATHYHTTAVNPDWAATLKFTKQIGSHRFYRFRWRERPVSTASVAVAPPT